MGHCTAHPIWPILTFLKVYFWGFQREKSYFWRFYARIWTPGGNFCYQSKKHKKLPLRSTGYVNVPAIPKCTVYLTVECPFKITIFIYSFDSFIIILLYLIHLIWHPCILYSFPLNNNPNPQGCRRLSFCLMVKVDISFERPMYVFFSDMSTVI